MWGLGWFSICLFALDAVLRFVLGLHVIMRRRPVTASLAWLLLLAAIPFVGVVLYLLIGENRLGRRRLAAYERLTKGLEAEAVELWRHRHQTFGHVEKQFEHIAHFGTGSTGMPPLRGNALTMLSDSRAMIDSLVADIDAAKSHVHILSYIWMCEGAGSQVCEAMIRAAGRGIECRILVDAVGSKHFCRCDLPEKMRKAGVQVVAALPANPVRMLFQRLDLRNHRKIAVIDGRVGYAGSQNITDDTFRSNRWRKTGPWIDATLRIDGPAAQALAIVFLRDWQLDAPEAIKDVDPYLPKLAPPEEHTCAVQVVPSGPGSTPEAIHQALLTTIYSARDELIMTTPYFVPDEALRKALQAAAMRGVKVTLVMPEVSDSLLVAAASRAHYTDLLEAGVRIMLYHGGLLHAKTVTVDRDMGMIGSANLDARSFWLNFEVTVFIYDDDFASVMRFMQMGYISHATEVHLDEWRRRPSWRNFLDNAAGLLGPLL